MDQSQAPLAGTNLTLALKLPRSNRPSEKQQRNADLCRFVQQGSATHGRCNIADGAIVLRLAGLTTQGSVFRAAPIMRLQSIEIMRSAVNI